MKTKPSLATLMTFVFVSCGGNTPASDPPNQKASSQTPIVALDHSATSQSVPAPDDPKSVALVPTDQLPAGDPPSSPADLAAAKEYRQIDNELKQNFDYDTGHHRYSGAPDEVLTAFRKNAEQADRWSVKLQDIVMAHRSPYWAAVAKARQGSVYDSCRSGLLNAESEIVLYTAREEQLLKKVAKLCNQKLSSKACGMDDQFRKRRILVWHQRRDIALQEVAKKMAANYVEAVLRTQAIRQRIPQVDRALERLATFEARGGMSKLAGYCEVTEPSSGRRFVYEAQLFSKLLGAANCLKSEVCKRVGRCSWQGGSCVAVSADDCVHSSGCKSHRRCALTKGVCTIPTG